MEMSVLNKIKGLKLIAAALFTITLLFAFAVSTSSAEPDTSFEAVEYYGRATLAQSDNSE